MGQNVSAFLSTLTLTALVVAPVAYAASVHLKGGVSAAPSFSDRGTTLNAKALLAGLGNGDVAVTISAIADPTATCTNSVGATQPPNHRPVPVQVSGRQSIPAREVDAGSVSFDVTTQPLDHIVGAPDCPRTRVERVNDLAFRSASIVVAQGPGQNPPEVLCIECSFDPDTSAGPIARGDARCASSPPPC